MDKILGFEDGEFRFLSNFWALPEPIFMYGLEFQTTEAAYQASKTLIPAERKKFAGAVSPAKAKRMGQNVTKRADWEQVKDSVMLQLLLLKFSSEPLLSKLLNTGDAYLEETNTWGDVYWGVCNGVGENKLGKQLMKVREMLRSADPLIKQHVDAINGR